MGLGIGAGWGAWEEEFEGVGLRVVLAVGGKQK